VVLGVAAVLAWAGLVRPRLVPAVRPVPVLAEPPAPARLGS
jgi:hypothetical protein